MKKTLALFLALLVLCLGGVQALAVDTVSYLLPETGLMLEMPAEWATITLETPKDAAALAALDINYREKEEYFTTYPTLYLSSFNPDDQDQYIDVYWGYQDAAALDYYGLSPQELREWGDDFLREYSNYDIYDIYTDETNQLTYLVLSGAYSDYALTEYYTLYQDYWLQIELNSPLDAGNHAAGLPILEHAVKTLQQIGEPIPGANRSPAPGSGLLGIPQPTTEYHTPAVIEHTMGGWEMLLAYLSLVGVFLLGKLSGQIFRKISRRNSVAQRRATYQGKLEQAAALKLRLDWYKALLYLVLPSILIVSPYIEIYSILSGGYYSNWREVVSVSENVIAMLGFVVSWLILYGLRRQLQLFSRAVFVLLAAYLIFTAADTLFLEQIPAPVLMIAYGLFMLLNIIYLWKRRHLLGPLPLFLPQPSAADTPNGINHLTAQPMATQARQAGAESSPYPGYTPLQQHPPADALHPWPDHQPVVSAPTPVDVSGQPPLDTPNQAPLQSGPAQPSAQQDHAAPATPEGSWLASPQPVVYNQPVPAEPRDSSEPDGNRAGASAPTPVNASGQPPLDAPNQTPLQPGTVQPSGPQDHAAPATPASAWPTPPQPVVYNQPVSAEPRNSSEPNGKQAAVSASTPVDVSTQPPLDAANQTPPQPDPAQPSGPQDHAAPATPASAWPAPPQPVSYNQPVPAEPRDSSEPDGNRAAVSAPTPVDVSTQPPLDALNQTPPQPDPAQPSGPQDHAALATPGGSWLASPQPVSYNQPAPAEPQDSSEPNGKQAAVSAPTPVNAGAQPSLDAPNQTPPQPGIVQPSGPQDHAAPAIPASAWPAPPQPVVYNQPVPTEPQDSGEPDGK